MNASFRAGISPRYFLKRYLQHGDMPLNADFEKHYIDLIREQSPG